MCQRNEMIPESVVLNGPGMFRVLHDQAIAIKYGLDARFFQILQSGAGGFEDGLLGRPKAKKGVPILFGQRPFRVFGDIAEQPPLARRDLLKIDPDRAR